MGRNTKRKGKKTTNGERSQTPTPLRSRTPATFKGRIRTKRETIRERPADWPRLPTTSQPAEETVPPSAPGAPLAMQEPVPSTSAPAASGQSGSSRPSCIPSMRERPMKEELSFSPSTSPEKTVPSPAPAPLASPAPVPTPPAPAASGEFERPPPSCTPSDIAQTAQAEPSTAEAGGSGAWAVGSAARVVSSGAQLAANCAAVIADELGATGPAVKIMLSAVEVAANAAIAASDSAGYAGSRVTAAMAAAVAAATAAVAAAAAVDFANFQQPVNRASAAEEVPPFRPRNIQDLMDAQSFAAMFGSDAVPGASDAGN